MIICACFGRGLACPIRRQRACRLKRRPSPKWWIASWAWRKARGFCCWRRWRAARRANSARNWPNSSAAALNASKSTASFIKLPRHPSSTRSSSTILKWWWTALWCAMASCSDWRIPSKPRSASPMALPMPKTPMAGNARFFPAASPARFPASPSRKSNHACFPSIHRMAPAPFAMGSARKAFSIRNWSCRRMMSR